jgi:hypothetical protein
LCRQLIAAQHGQVEPLPAVDEYEWQMLDYGFGAVQG